MKRLLATIIFSLAVGLIYSASPAHVMAQPQPLPAASFDAEGGAQKAKPKSVPNCLFGTYNSTTGDCSGSGGLFKTIANILIFLTGAIAVIVIIFGGLRYVVSTGDAARIKQAKDTILYGVIGLVIAILAYALVNFVVTTLTPQA